MVQLLQVAQGAVDVPVRIVIHRVLGGREGVLGQLYRLGGVALL